MKWRRKFAGLPSPDALATWSTGSSPVSSSCLAGFCLVFGLAEVQRLAGMIAVFPAVTYAGFGAPYLLSVLHAYAPASALLLAMAALGAVT